MYLSHSAEPSTDTASMSEACLCAAERKRMNNFKIGHGYDVHRLVKERKLILGGVSVPYEYGLLGHSDADVLLHAVIDAVFGALGEGDIGRHFPDTDESYKGISSLELLKRCAEIADARGYRLSNADVTVIAQRPRLAAYIPKMIKNISEVFGADEGAVNIKATTEEGLGFTGSGEGIAAHCVVLLERREGRAPQGEARA